MSNHRKEEEKLPESHEKNNKQSKLVYNEHNKLCENLMKKSNYYDILGVNKNATEEEIKKAYKKQALKFHPDKNQSENASEAFNKISHAFSNLKDEEKKRFYDLHGNEEEAKQNHANQHTQRTHTRRQRAQEQREPFNLFEMFFEGRERQRRRENDHAERRQQYYAQYPNQEHEERNNRRHRRQNGQGLFIQILPLIIILIITFLPSLLNRVHIFKLTF